MGSTAARLNSSSCAAALLPVHRHQREDEVGLVELDALGVDPDEDLGDLFLVGCGAELDDLEPEVAEVVDPVDALLEVVLLRRR